VGVTGVAREAEPAFAGGVERHGLVPNRAAAGAAGLGTPLQLAERPGRP